MFSKTHQINYTNPIKKSLLMNSKITMVIVSEKHPSQNAHIQQVTP